MSRFPGRYTGFINVAPLGLKAKGVALGFIKLRLFRDKFNKLIVNH